MKAGDLVTHKGGPGRSWSLWTWEPEAQRVCLRATQTVPGGMPLLVLRTWDLDVTDDDGRVVPMHFAELLTPHGPRLSHRGNLETITKPQRQG